MTAGVQVVWFKRDLRVNDHRPLARAAERGPIVGLWVYEPEAEALTLLYESPGTETLSGPDNISAHPQGQFLAICEDALKPKQLGRGQRIQLLTKEGEIAPFCENAMEFPDFERRRRGLSKSSYTRAEWAGVCFSADGRWMFANIYDPGVTVAITGPWL